MLLFEGVLYYYQGCAYEEKFLDFPCLGCRTLLERLDQTEFR